MTAVPAVPVPVSIPALAAPPVWPASAVLAPDGDVAVAGVPLMELAERYGTPVYVLDEDEVRARARAWRRALPDADVVYAAKAFLCRAVVDWIADEGLGLGVCSAAELELAASRGFPADRVVLHGDAKSPQDLATALRLGVGRVVIESQCEIARLASRVPGPEAQQVMVRISPGVAAGERSAVGGGAELPFGLSVATGDAEDAVARIMGQPRLQLVGVQISLGTQIATPEPYVRGVRRAVAFLARVRDRFGVTLPEVDLGGGFAVAYLPGDPAPSPAAYGRRVQDALVRCCAEFDLPLPRLTVEPGRSVVGPAGVALYRVLAVRRSATGRAFVAVDGGVGDNPRPALYGARYSVRMIGRAPAAPMRATTVVGRHCEAGDVLAEGVELPEDVRPGDVLAVPASGAYHVSMASGYDMTGRPPVVAVAGARSRLLVRREGFDDHRARDVGL